MKKVSVIALLTIYSLSSFGIGINEFYCCGKLKSVNITFTTDKNEKCSKESDKDNCCKNKYQFFKVKDTYTAADAVKCQLKYVADADIVTPSFQLINSSNNFFSVANGSHAPPRPATIPIYLSNCIFRI